MKSSTIDYTGVAVSTLCLVHCIMLPAIVTALPVMGVFANNEHIHKALVFVALFPAIYAFSGLFERKATASMRGLALFGITALLAGAFVEALHDMETVLTLIGALSLGAAHISKVFLRHSHKGE